VPFKEALSAACENIGEEYLSVRKPCRLARRIDSTWFQRGILS
jgi:hypothetical protein